MEMTIFSIAFSLFLLMDPIGNVPLYISFLKGISPARQRVIIIRELLVALAIIVLFNFIGDALMNFLKVSDETIQIAGGIILFIISLKMIFPHAKTVEETMNRDTEPFIVPLAVPLVAGPSVLTAVMIYGRQEENNALMLGAILMAWAASLLILISSSFLERFLGWRGIIALERLMGLILTLIAVQMFLSGVYSFMHLSP
jgi:multiple antibiotic resistance protein